TRTTFTNYVAPTDVWLLNTYTEQCASDDAAFRGTTVSSCADLTAGKKAVQKFCFDGSNGFLNRRWTQQGDSPAKDDVVVAFDSESVSFGTTSTRATGNVAEERDALAPDVASGADLCSVSLQPQYTIDNTYAYGVL